MLAPFTIKSNFNRNLTSVEIVFFLVTRGEIKHPLVVITQTLENVSDLPSRYKYQLYCNSLCASAQNSDEQIMRRLNSKLHICLSRMCSHDLIRDQVIIL